MAAMAPKMTMMKMAMMKKVMRMKAIKTVHTFLLTFPGF